MKNNFLSRCAVLVFLMLTILFFSSCVKKTDEDLILEFMERIGKYAEKKDIDSIMMNLAYDYSDFEGRDKWEAKEFIDGYFKQYRGIVIHVLSTRIEEINLPEAFVQSEVALSSGAARVFRKLVRFSTENYRLTLKLIKKDERWQILHAEWKYVTLDELYPESLTIFNKIFKID
ncbi:MAG: nuclear transport factor 2 family protein [Candidatus Aminicenantes bacterium]